LAGLNPKDPTSKFAATVSKDTTGNLIVTWPSVAGKHYFVETSTDLQKWTALPTDYIGTGANLSANVRPAGASSPARGFWHVVVFDVDSTGSGLNDWERTQMAAVATITATSGTGGKIAPSGITYLAKGDNQTFTISPATGYIVDQVTVDKVAQGAVRNYTFANISAGTHTIAATFKLDSTISVSPTSLSIPASGGSPTLTLTTTGSWTVSTTDSWLSASQSSGSGNTNITITAVSNTGAARSGTITVQGSGSSLQVVVAQSGAPINLAKGKTAKASSSESANGPDKAVDGNIDTRWASGWTDTEWIMVDLGNTYNVSQVVLIWEAAYASSYKIQTSSDSTQWTDAATQLNGTSGTQKFNMTASCRYVRMLGVKRATSWGYSIFEFQVMGDPTPLAPTITTQPANLTGKEGDTVSFSVVATGKGTLAYQWFRQLPGATSFDSIAGATTSTYTTPALSQQTDNGSLFKVQVTDTITLLSTTSKAATLKVTGPRPTITLQPKPRTVPVGTTAIFYVQSTSRGPQLFQWYRAAAGSTSFTVIAGATSDSYRTSAATLADNNTQYRVRISDTSTGFTIDSIPVAVSVIDADVRAAALVAKLTQDEKIHLVHGLDNSYNYPRGCIGYIEGISRLGIPTMYLSDGGVGCRVGESTVLPAGICSAAAWDENLAYEYGRVIGKDMRAHGMNINLGGNVNLMGREPRCGRSFETSGEDPILAGVSNAIHIQAVQDQKIVADIKHFAFNDQETNRSGVNVVIDERAARQTDLLAFEIGIKDTTVQSVMAAYNKFRDQYCSENQHLLNNILKKEWGFAGFVMSDWGGTHSCASAANNGLDMEMPGYDNFGNLAAAVSANQVPQSRLDNMVHRILRALIASGVVDDPVQIGTVDAGPNLAIAQAVAESGTVLLKNANNQLPLRPAALKTVAVIGPHADRYVISGGGSAQVMPLGGGALNDGTPAVTGWAPVIWQPSSPLETIRAKVGSAANVVFDDGSDHIRAATLAKTADVAIVFAPEWSSEAMDQPSFNFSDVAHSPPYDMDGLITAVSNQNAHTIVVLETGRPVLMPWVDKVTAVLAAWFPGQRGAEAIAGILFGDVNPSGKLPLTFPRNASDFPYQNIPNDTADYNYTGLNVGYKWYDAKKITPLFPFGFGLSYTTFSISNASKTWDGSRLTVELDITNTGTVAGAEVAQIYLSMPASLNEPPKRLIGWRKVFLEPGASTHLTLIVESGSSAHPLSYWDTASNAWKIGNGDYEVFLGNSSRSMNSLGTLHIGP
jgi:beta-glucosidase